MAKNYWPHAIVTALILIVASCVATIILAVKNPVEMDGFYFERYQNVDENINEIEASQRRFDDKYALKFEAKFDGQILKTAPVTLPKKGRWQILLKISDSNDTGFYKFNFEAR